MTEKLTKAEHAALERVAASHVIATQWIAIACGFGHATDKARRLLQSLAKRGFVEGVSASRGSRVYWWRITDSGRSALGEKT